MSTLKVNNITDTSGGSSNLTVPGAAKAWVNFDGTGSIALNDSFNVSSITDQGAGEYDINFTTAMSNANYAVAATTSIVSNEFRGVFERRDGTTRSTTTFRITTAPQSASSSGLNAGESDEELMSVVVFAD